MQPVVSISWKKFAALVSLIVSSACVFAADVAGSVSFVLGEASVIDADGKSRPLTRDANIEAGQTLETGATGHIHLRMIDGAFVSVRPQSRLRIENYHYDTAVSANNRIKFVLEKGVARSITGRAGEASKENYRFNTPLAAIGIRGTDFVVQAAADITRVTVQSGAVVMAPLAADCLASTLGPCKSASSRVLTAAMRDAYLELRNRNEAPRLVPAEKALESPNLLAPPRPEEPRSGADKQAKSDPNIDARDAVRDAATDTLKNKLDAAAAVPLPPQQFWWGRWSMYIQPGQESSSIHAAIAPGREVAVVNDVFGVMRESGTVVLPNSGVAKFQLGDAEAYFKEGANLILAKVTSPSLTIDFGARRFDTALTVNSSGYSPVLVQSSGQVSWQGDLWSDVTTPGTVLQGSLSKDASQAAYVFQRDVNNRQSVVGVTRWYR